MPAPILPVPMQRKPLSSRFLQRAGSRSGRLIALRFREMSERSTVRRLRFESPRRFEAAGRPISAGPTGVAGSLDATRVPRNKGRPDPPEGGEGKRRRRGRCTWRRRNTRSSTRQREGPRGWICAAAPGAFLLATGMGYPDYETSTAHPRSASVDGRCGGPDSSTRTRGGHFRAAKRSRRSLS